MLKPAMETVVVPALVSETAEETCCPLVTVPKLIDAGLNERAVPVPDNATVWGLVISLSDTVRVPEA
jgi:hypothetical protein